MLDMTMKEARGGFFDRKAVMAAVSEGSRKVLSRFGAFVRTRARSSIRKRKRISDPGAPPSSHVDTLRQLIYFAYDARRNSVVIGPTRFGAGTAPAILEKGGNQVVGTVTMRYKPRPFMGPAFREELQRAPELWRNSIRG